MKLISMKINPNGKTGWRSSLLEFGNNITQLFGPNGCGKTPIVQPIVYCLGYPCTFRSDIYSNCNHVVLEVKTKRGNIQICRLYNRGFDIVVTEQNGTKQKFNNEREYSDYLFELHGLTIRNLVTNRNTLTHPYLSSMLPIYYLDQDEGYSKIYRPPSSFIKDQFSEMVRMIFNLPVKNSFDLKKEKIDTKKELDFLDKQVSILEQQIVHSKKNTEIILKSSKELNHEIIFLESEINQLKSSGAVHSDSINSLDSLILDQKNNIRELDRNISELNKRINGVDQINQEIYTEIETLNLNEEARRVFLSFNEICGAQKCQLFSFSSDSYSKNLLYLKDQIKDLERNSEIDIIKINHLQKTEKSI